MLDLQPVHRVRRRAVDQQRDRPIHPNRVLVRVCSTNSHRPLEYHISRPIPPRWTRNRPLKLEVRYCVGAVASPLLANIALSALDEHFAERWDDRVERAKRRRHGLPNYRLIRYADDFVVMVSGTKAHAQAVQNEVAAVLSPIGLRLSDLIR